MDGQHDQKRLADLGEQLISAAKAAGAEAADAVVVQGRALSVSCRLGKVEEIDQAEGDDLGLRVMIGKRQAIVSANRPDPREFAALAERAVAMARLAPEDPYCGLADKALLARDWPDLDMLDMAAISADELRDLALAAEQAALGVTGISNSNGASAGRSLGGMVLITSDGFSGSYLGSHFSVSCSPIAGSGTAMERDYDYASVNHFADLPDAASIGRSAGERTVRRLNPRKIASGRFPVFFEARAANSLIGHFLGAISGAAVARKTSFLRDCMNEAVFAAGISIVEDPLRRRGLRSKPFDGEGVATQKLKLVEKGVLKSWLLDSASARELGLVSNGHASRGTGSPPSPGASNVHLEPGIKSPDQLIKDMGRGLYVTDLIGHGVNGVTGDYSRGAAGFWVENGEIAYPVSEITIASNLKDMYASMVPADDLEFRYGVNSPGVLIAEMTLAGQ